MLRWNLQNSALCSDLLSDLKTARAGGIRRYKDSDSLQIQLGRLAPAGPARPGKGARNGHYKTVLNSPCDWFDTELS